MGNPYPTFSRTLYIYRRRRRRRRRHHQQQQQQLNVQACCLQGYNRPRNDDGKTSTRWRIRPTSSEQPQHGGTCALSQSLLICIPDLAHDEGDAFTCPEVTLC